MQDKLKAGTWSEIRNFSKHPETVAIPSLIMLQTKAWERFFQRYIAPDERLSIGLQAILNEAFPIKSPNNDIELEFISYELSDTRYTPMECRDLRLTYGLPLKVKLRLHRGEKGVVEEFVFFGEIPLMLGGGEFIINGAERVIVTQLHRSPGVDFSEEILGGERKVQTCWIIPERGSWVEIAVSKKDTLNVHIDQSGKFSAMTYLRAMWDIDEHGNPMPKYSSNEEIIRRFYNTKIITLGEVAEPDRLRTKKIVKEFLDSLKPISRPMPDRIGLGEKPITVVIPLPKRGELFSKKEDETEKVIVTKEVPFIPQDPEPVTVEIKRKGSKIPEKLIDQLLYYRIAKSMKIRGKVYDVDTLIDESLLQDIWKDKDIIAVIRRWGINLNLAEEAELEYSHKKFDTGFIKTRVGKFIKERKKVKIFRTFEQGATICLPKKELSTKLKNWNKIFYLGEPQESLKKNPPKNLIKKLVGKKIAEKIALGGGRTLPVNHRLDEEDVKTIFQTSIPAVTLVKKFNMNIVDEEDLLLLNETYKTGFTKRSTEKYLKLRDENGPFHTMEDARKGTGIKQENFLNWSKCFFLAPPEEDYIPEAPDELYTLLENWKLAKDIEIGRGQIIHAGTFLTREHIDLVFSNENIKNVLCWQYNLNIIDNKRLFDLNQQLDFRMGKRAGDISRKISEVLKSGPLRSFEDFKSRIKLPDEVSNELSKYFYFGPKDERDAETVKQKLIKALLGKRLAKEVKLAVGKVLLAKYRRLSQADIENLYNTPEVDVVLVLKPDFDEFFIDPPQHTNADIEGKPNEEQILDNALRPREIELIEENKKTLLTHFIYHEVLLPDKRLVPAFTKMTSEQVEILFTDSSKKTDGRKKIVEKKPVIYKVCSKVNKEWIITGHKKKGTVKEDIVKTLQGTFTVSPVIDPNTGEHIIDQFMLIPKEKAEVIIQSGLHEIEVIEKVDDPLILNSLADDPSTSHEDALIRIYSKLRQGTPPNLEKARQLFFEKFYDDQRYKLGSVGRFRLNRKFNSDISEEKQTLQQDDVANVIEYILLLRGRKNENKPEAQIDDIDHLGNRRLKTIEELVSDELRKGFLKLKKSVIDKMNSDSPENLTPRTLINSKAITTAMNYFFARGELSQVVDQTNPLSQLTHERRLSALGPGGLNRKRAGFDVRDVHISHYGRICPIETPEGANIGLISSLGIFAYIDKYGFLTTPYRVVKNKVVTGEIVNLRADQEIDMIIAPADVELDEHNRMVNEVVMARVGDEYQFVPAENIQYTDISPKQMVGVSAALIPFLEHDDTARALMGSNMQRQAVPLIQCEPPRVATGMEKFIPKNSGMCKVSEQDGTVVYSDALTIIIKDKDKIENTYNLEKYVGLNDRSCLAQKPIVRPGQKVKLGQVIADGPGTANGELAIGKNIFVAFLPWDGYNFEDAIIISEKLVRNDVYTSIHIDEFEKEIRETKLGKEEFTHEIPNVSTRARRYLEPDTGLVMLGTKVAYDDILVGKISPKSKSELTAEEKLLHAIFGKAGDDVKDDSLRVPSGTEGIVIKTQKFARKSALSDDERKSRKKDLEKSEELYYKTASNTVMKIFDEIKSLTDKQIKTLGELQIQKKIKFDEKSLRQYRMRLNFDNIVNSIPEASKHRDTINILLKDTDKKIDDAEKEYNKVVNRISKGDELPTGVLEKARVVVATRRTLSVGDKFAGRHGNKGVVSIILPIEDMPFLEDGTPVDMILNPLGVPSRMNVGQIMELHLGWAAHKLGVQMVTPVFDGASESEVEQALKEAGLPLHGKVQLYDGRTGRPFDQETAIGYMYMLKLHHLVDDKVHARATGPYSLITQQPLGGKARFGGQRFGEMEVWALEAYGASAILQEMLTVKSDDVEGRTKIYESMVKGSNTLEPGTPVSFDVLCSEIKGLALNIELFKKELHTEEDIKLLEMKKKGGR